MLNGVTLLTLDVKLDADARLSDAEITICNKLDCFVLTSCPHNHAYNAQLRLQAGRQLPHTCFLRRYAASRSLSYELPTPRPNASVLTACLVTRQRNSIKQAGEGMGQGWVTGKVTQGPAQAAIPRGNGLRI